MEVVEGVIGNVGANDSLAAAERRHGAAGTLERLILDGDQRRRSRFRAQTDAGSEVGVVAGEEPLEPGDVLLLADDRMVVVALADVDALAVSFGTDTSPTAAVNFGHVVGNRHWELTTAAGTVYVPAGPDPERRRQLLLNSLPETATVRTTEVSPELFSDDEPTDGHAHPNAEHDHGTNGQAATRPGGDRGSRETGEDTDAVPNATPATEGDRP